MPTSAASEGPRHGRGYPFGEIEQRWRDIWRAADSFRSARSEDLPKWFVMELPPFANGELHLGHARNYAIADACARFRRMAGYNVLYTSGFDTFGLPNEIAAREANCHPLEFAERCSATMAAQFLRLGLSHDRRRIMGYHEPAYYRWVQWVFVKLFEFGYAFRKKAPVSWCPDCRCSLADSLVEGGRCWRCKSPVQEKMTEQWFVREVEFADEMLDGMHRLSGWPEAIKRIHRDWIGRCEGTIVRCALRNLPDFEIEVFYEDLSRLAATAFIAVGRDHPLIERIAGRGLPDGGAGALGVDVELPLQGRSVPLVAVPKTGFRSLDSALPGVPGLDRNDREIAAELGIAWSPVMPHTEAAAGESRREWLRRLSAAGVCKAAVAYRLRDWSIARQRYWGPPVPIVHCGSCGAVPVAESDLPVLLPMDVDLSVAGNPLDRHPGFLAAVCPRCKAAARRDTDTLEAYSSPWWYHWLCKSEEADSPFSPADSRAWLPVDVMIGGRDQVTSCFFHVRMIAKALKRMAIAELDEPVDTVVAIGLVKIDGRKMSKSSGNAVELERLIQRYGADAVRLGILGAAAPDQDFAWSEDLIERQHAFLAQLWEFVLERASSLRLDATSLAVSEAPGGALRRRFFGWLETAEFKITESLLRHQNHLAVKNAAFLFDRLAFFDRKARRGGVLSVPDAGAVALGLRSLLLMLAPLAPHIAEELWSACALGGTAGSSAWPASLAAHASRKHLLGTAMHAAERAQSAPGGRTARV